MGKYLRELRRRAALYPHDPVAYALRHLRRDLTPQQAEILRLLETPPYRLLCRSANTQGKCLHPDDFVQLIDGSRAKARELVGREFTLLTPAGARMARAGWDATVPTYRITLDSGEVLRRTGNHKLYDGHWRRVSVLAPGDSVAVPIRRDYEGTDTLSDDLAIFAAYMIGDGGCTQSSLTFSQLDSPQLTEFRDVCSRLNIELVSCGGVDYRLRRIDRDGDSPGDAARLVGIWKKHSRDKRIPDPIFSATLRQQRLFLNRLYSTDGWASVAIGRKGACEIGFCSASEHLCRDIQELVSRFGIRGTVKKRGKYWLYLICAARDCERFFDTVGIYGKESACDMVRASAALVTENRGAWRYRDVPDGMRRERIKSIEVEPPVRTVAIEVPGLNTYYTNVYEHNTYVGAIKSSHTHDSFDPSVVMITAPVAAQVKDLAFKELRGVRLTQHGFLPKAPRLESSADHFVHGFTAATPDGFHGRHARYLGIWFDEATGVDYEFWKRAETMFGGHAGHWWLCTYNPNDPSSPAFLEEETGSWHIVELSALDHPNILAELRGEDPPIPAAIRLVTVQRRIANECEQINEGDFDPATDFEFPRGSGNFYRPITMHFEAQVLGRWPISASDAIWTTGFIETLPRHSLNPMWELQGGIDVARFGDDDSTLAVRRGPCLLAVEAHAHRRLPWLAQRMRELLCRYAPDQDTAKRVKVYIDDTGGYGSGLIDYREDWNWMGVNAASESPDPRFPNMRSYLWFRTRAIADAGYFDMSHLGEGERKAVKIELCAPRYHLDAKNRRVVEIKTQIKKRLKRSPDRADAVNLAYLCY